MIRLLRPTLLSKVSSHRDENMKPARRAPGTTRKLFALSLAIALAM